jgi:hypothetical protein
MTTVRRASTVRKATTVSVALSCLVLATCGAGPSASVGGRDSAAARTTGPARAQSRTVELATLARSWSSNWTVLGAKTEPTYVEHVRISRRGDRFTLDADANGEPFGRIEMSVDDRGRIAVLDCPRWVRCDTRPTGFLATVPVLAAARRGQLAGAAPVLGYAGREVACVPAELLRDGATTGAPGVTARDADGSSTVDLRAVIDPCLDTRTGAVLAQRSRDDGSFAGPTLDEDTLVVRELTTEQHAAGSRPYAGLPLVMEMSC